MTRRKKGVSVRVRHGAGMSPTLSDSLHTSILLLQLFLLNLSNELGVISRKREQCNDSRKTNERTIKKINTLAPSPAKYKQRSPSPPTKNHIQEHNTQHTLNWR
jgi:hypothetical protein